MFHRIQSFIEAMYVHSVKYSVRENWTWDEVTIARMFLLVGFILGVLFGCSLFFGFINVDRRK